MLGSKIMYVSKGAHMPMPGQPTINNEITFLEHVIEDSDAILEE